MHRILVIVYCLQPRRVSRGKIAASLGGNTPSRSKCKADVISSHTFVIRRSAMRLPNRSTVSLGLLRNDSEIHSYPHQGRSRLRLQERTCQSWPLTASCCNFGHCDDYYHRGGSKFHFPAISTLLAFHVPHVNLSAGRCAQRKFHHGSSRLPSAVKSSRNVHRTGEGIAEGGSGS